MTSTISTLELIQQNCDPAAYLRGHHLRKFSMPLDWVMSPSLTDVNRLLAHKFTGFMELYLK
ncbi:DUF1796 family putative cysteine peptidase [Paenibacillus aceris]|uniref:DUF1796 family putative cysteine peptidase n=1 Tax=Paenibacillus aceris TaxID=869555 RepID=UPI00141DC3BE|nr:DUF1796 family putative cysteine peptidase [Paenibacillus aceris]NHW36816.1 hypothetical protein [Paenibacillus aceris]